MKTVVVGIPIRQGLDSNFMKGLIPALRDGIPGIKLQVLVIEGPSVNFARNTVATECLLQKADELVFIDDDMQWDMLRLYRLLSHDVDIVGGYYCKRRPGKPQWLFVPKPGAEEQPNGLLECSAIATGFLRIKCHVFTRMMELFPEHAFLAKDTERDPVRASFDWFRMGVFGPDTAESKLEEIKSLYDQWKSAEEFSEKALGVLNRKPKPGRLLGEDYGWCHQARKAGFKVYVDLGMPVVGHMGLVSFPITPEMVGFGSEIDQEMPVAEAL